MKSFHDVKGEARAARKRAKRLFKRRVGQTFGSFMGFERDRALCEPELLSISPEYCAKRAIARAYPSIHRALFPVKHGRLV